MTALVYQGRDDAWRWEILDESGQTYLRSNNSFADISMAEKDLEFASHLVRPQVGYRYGDQRGPVKSWVSLDNRFLDIHSPSAVLPR